MIEERLIIVQKLIDTFRMERIMYLVLTILSALLLIGGGIYLMITADDYRIFLTLLAPTGTLTYCIFRILKMWDDALRFISATEPDKSSPGTPPPPPGTLFLLFAAVTSDRIPKRRRSMWWVPVVAIFSVLAGYIVVMVVLGDSFDQIKQNKQQIARTHIELSKQQHALDSITLLRDKYKKEVQELETAKDRLVQKAVLSNNTALAENATRINKETKTALNVIRTEYEMKREQERAPVTSKIIYVQVGSVATKNRLGDLHFTERLNSSPNGYRVYGYDLEEGRTINEIRYFHEEDAGRARGLREFILSIDPQLALKTVYIEQFKDKVPPGQMEVWVK